MKKKKPLILISNDDGVRAQGLRVLKRFLKGMGEVIAVAPDRPRSSVSHSVTLHKPLRIEEMLDSDGDTVYACNGTPADCVALGIRVVCHKPPDLVVSGINAGANVGDEVIYSGTVAAAIEATLHGVLSFAISIAAKEHLHYESAGVIASRLAERLLQSKLPPDVLFNVNVPNLPLEKIAGVQLTRRGKKRYTGDPEKRLDPFGKAYYWRGSERPITAEEEGTDVTAISKKIVSITPLHTDNTSLQALQLLSGWDWELLK